MAKVVLRSIFLSFVFLLATILAERPGYFITAPNVFHIGVEETVSVSVYNVSQRLKIKLYLQDYPNRQKILSSAESTFANADKLKIVKLKVNPEDLPASEPGDKQHVYLVAHSLSPSLPFIKYTKILVSPRNAVVFIQTDKPIYTPIQTVKIRVIPLEFDLRSSSTKINLVIKNPQQVNVQQWKDLNTDTGFISKNLPLQGSAMIGNWTISAFYGHQMSQNTTVKFEVREYVLPTYSVKISGPDYILLRDKTVSINIASSYTYGKPVEGEVHVKLSVVGLGKEPVLVFSQYGPLKSGKKTFQFLNNVVKNHRLIQNFPSGRRLQVEADVVEKATGRKESAIDNSIYFVESPFIVNCDQTPKYFKPGLPFEVKVRVLYPNRNPASGIELHLTASGTDSKGGQVKVLGKINGRTVLRLDDRTDGKGVVYFVIDIPRNAKSVKMKVETKEPGLPNANKELVVKPYQSPSGSYILIRENREREKLGQYEVLSNKNISRLTYMVVARGKIVTQRSMRRAFGVITTIKIPMTPELSPSARIIVHCTVNGNEVVADSLLIDPEDKLSNEIQLLPDDRSSNTNGNNNNKEFPPGSNYQIRIKGKPNTRVALLGLDKSVYLLRNKHKLTKKKVFKTLGSLDLGCGVGPEETNKEVFEKAGLAVISNKNLVTAPREEFGCKESSSKRRKRSLISDLKVCCGEGKFILGRSTCERKLKFKFNRGLHTEACLRMFYNCCLAEWGDADEPPFDDVVFIRGRNFKKELEEFVPEQSEEELIESRQDRTDFPETWIYEEDVIGTSGELSLDVTLPQTITSWSIQAMAVSNTSGFGMAAPLSVRTYQPFFVSVSLPYSVQRGEQFVVVATVFSYVPRELGIDEGEVKIHIEGSDDFCSSVRPGQRSKPVTLTLKHQDSQTAMFPIVPIRLGKIPIKVAAVSTKFGSADIVEKMLLVVPEGVERTITHSLAIDPQGVLRDVDKPNKTAPTKPFTSGRIIGDGRQMDHVLLTIPKRAIPGSMSAMLSITGNLIGPVVTNLITGGFDELLRMPTGCGEQTMIYMAPNVYVLQYLTNTKQVTASVESRAYRYIQSGYQNELNYRRADKSFSAFGESRPGSTWLTAFVMRVFCAAQKFGIAIDENLICESVTWLSSNQRADGAFPERHDVVHKSMTGGIHGDVAMTSFVLMSLMECRCKGKKNTVAVSRAVSYLEMELRNVYRPHAVAMTTYALVLANSPQRFKANQKLTQMALYDSDKATRHWNAGGIALNIETSAYALLTQILMGRVKYAGPIVSWLTAQRNAQGGFSSTQDTCVALEALAKYSERTAGANLDLRISLTAERDSSWRRTVHITNQNALVMTQEDISRVMGGDIFIDSSGSGVGQLQIEVRHNVPSSRNESCLFDVTTVVRERFKNKRGSVLGRAGSDDDDDDDDDDEDGDDGSHGHASGRHRKCRRKNKKNRKNKKKCKRRKKEKTQPKTPDSLTLKICTRYRKPGKSGMTIMDIGIFTGFEADSESLEQLKKNVRPTVDRFEISDRHVVLYVSEVYSHKEFCAIFKVNRKHKVGTIQPVPVKVYDYYEPDEACTKFYGPDKYSALVLGICEGEQCRCTQDACSACDPIVKKTTDLLTKACTEYDYAFRVTVGLVDERDKGKESWLVYTMTIQEVIKPGEYNFVVGELVDFMKRAGCRCPDMKMKKDYLVIGMNKRQQFLLDDKTFVKRWPRKGKEKDVFIDFRARMSSQNRCG